MGCAPDAQVVGSVQTVLVSGYAVPLKKPADLGRRFAQLKHRQEARIRFSCPETVSSVRQRRL